MILRRALENLGGIAVVAGLLGLWALVTRF